MLKSQSKPVHVKIGWGVPKAVIFVFFNHITRGAISFIVMNIQQDNDVDIEKLKIKVCLSNDRRKL